MKKSLSIAIAAIAFLAPSFAYADIWSNLSVWLKLDAGTGTTVIDSSGKGNNGSLSGGVTWTPGKIGPYGLMCNGTSQQFTVPYSSSGNPSASFTVSTWIQTSTLNTSDYAIFVSTEAFPNTGFILFYNGPSTDYVGFGVDPGRSGSTCSNIGSPNCANFNKTALNNGIWHMVTGVYDGTNVYLYLDGALQDTKTAGTYTVNSTIATYGCLGGFTNNSITLKQDDVRIYNRALSSSDVAQLYAYTGITYQTFNVVRSVFKIVRSVFNTI